MTHTTKVRNKTIRLRESVYKRVKALAVKHEITISQVIDGLLPLIGK